MQNIPIFVSVLFASTGLCSGHATSISKARNLKLEPADPNNTSELKNTLMLGPEGAIAP